MEKKKKMDKDVVRSLSLPFLLLSLSLSHCVALIHPCRLRMAMVAETITLSYLQMFAQRYSPEYIHNSIRIGRGSILDHCLKVSNIITRSSVIFFLCVWRDKAYCELKWSKVMWTGSRSKSAYKICCRRRPYTIVESIWIQYFFPHPLVFGCFFFRHACCHPIFVHYEAVRCFFLYGVVW